MDNKEEFITIKEAATLVNVNPNTLYRYIEKKRISCDFVFSNGKNIRKLKKSEVLKVFSRDRESQRFSENPEENLRDSQEKTLLNTSAPFHENLKRISEIPKENLIDSQENLRLTLKEVVKETIAEERNQLMKPIEEQALYRLGGLEKENLFLKERLETVINEYKELQDKIKALPDLQKEKENIEKQLLEEKKELESKLKQEEIEKTELEAKLKAEEAEKARAKAEAEEALKQLTSLPAPVESIQQILLDNATNLTKLAKEKENFSSVLKEHEATIQEKERALKELDELRRQEIEGLKKQAEEREAKLKAEAEEREKQIAEAWKKELEEAKKPWWKKLW